MKSINKLYLFSFLLILFLLVVVFSNIFSYHLIAAGDYSTVNKAYLVDAFENAFFSWNDGYNLGQNNTAFMNYAPYTFLIGFLGKLVHFNGIVVERIVWWLPFFSLAFISHFFLKRLVPQIGKFGFFSSFIFLFNTYTLMLLGGGQISGVGLAYAMAAIVLVLFIELSNKDSVKSSLFVGLIFAIQVMFDVRIAYVTMVALLLYLLLQSKEIFSKNILKKFVSIFVIPLGVTGLLHAFWILPTLIYHQNPIQQLGDAFNSTKAVTFFSFAKFENSFALLHPNWPENIFGKVSFMKPEFLLLPLLAFSSLLFLNAEHLTPKVKKNILFFCLLGLLGAFLGKGANDPFGSVYLWMFEHVSGFFMFRDPSKWYILTVLSYMVLIPFSLWELYAFLKSYNKVNLFSFKLQINSTNKIFNLQNVLVIFVFGYFLLLIRPAFQGQLTGAFQARNFPQEYMRYNAFIDSQPQFFRTFWVPVPQRYGNHMSQHPVISGEDFFAVTSPQQVIKKLGDKKTQQLLQDAGVKYIVVPDDSEGEIFLTDRKYDEKLRASIIKDLDTNTWLKKKIQFDNIIVYETPVHQNLFWQKNNQLLVTRISPVHYQLSAKNKDIQGDVMFSAKYDHYWLGLTNDEKVMPLPFENRFNRFYISSPTRIVDINYSPQRWVNRGVWISLGSLVLVIGSLIILKKR